MSALTEKDLQRPLADALKKVGKDMIVVGPKGRPSHAIIPYDDNAVDYILEHSPRLIRECAAIRERMEAGEYYTLEEIIAEFADDKKPATKRRAATGAATKRRAKKP